MNEMQRERNERLVRLIDSQLRQERFERAMKEIKVTSCRSITRSSIEKTPHGVVKKIITLPTFIVEYPNLK